MVKPVKNHPHVAPPPRTLWRRISGLFRRDLTGMHQAELEQTIQQVEDSRADAIRSRDSDKAKLRQLQRSPLALEHRQLRKRWVVRVNQPMLLISQVQRAGGTLLSRLFDAHPECFAHPMELKWGRPRKWNWPSFNPDANLGDGAAFSLVDEMWVRKVIRSGGYYKYAQWTQTHKSTPLRRQPFVFDRELEFELFADMYASRRVGHRRDVLDAYLTALFNAWLDYQNLYATPKRWVTCFVPRLVMHPDSLERYFADYPDGMLITIVRHPGSWFASASRHTFSADPVEALQHWIDSTRASLAAADRYGERVTVILFEDLVLHTEATMRAICARVGLTFAPILQRPTYNSMPVLSNSSFHLTTEIDSAVTQRKTATLTPEQRDVIERLALGHYNDVAARFGLNVLRP